jgi:hypothetical protein
LTAHLYACAINNPKAYIHHPHADRFLYRHADDSLELYDPKVHGENVWAPVEGEGDETAEEVMQASISLF